MATVPAGSRSTAFTTVSTTAGPFNVGFRLFDTDSLDVYLNGVRTTAFTISATFVDGFTDSATLTLITAVVSGTRVVIDGALTPRREADYLPGDAGLTAKLNIELPRLWSALAEVKRDSERSVRGLVAIAPAEEITTGLTVDAFTSAAQAASSAAQAALFEGPWLDNVAALLANTSLGYAAAGGNLVTAGEYVRTRAEGFSYLVAASGAVNQHVTTAGGVKLYVLPNDGGEYNLAAFGAVGDGVTDDRTAVQTAFSNGGRICIPKGRTFLINNTVYLSSNTTLCGGGKFKAGVPAGFNDVGPHVGMIMGNVVDNVVIEGCEFDNSNWTSLPSGSGDGVTTGSARCIHFFRSSYIRVRNNFFEIKTGAVSYNGGSDHETVNNRINVSQMGALATTPADGVIDTWPAFDVDIFREIVTGNVIRGAVRARWGIVFTALTFSAQFMTISQVVISNNIIENCVYDGMWVFGRNADLIDAVIADNMIFNCRKGISVSDARHVSITGNVIDTMSSSGIHLWKETEAGGILGVNASLVANNILANVASAGDATNPAIWLETAADCLVVGNAVRGSTHGIGIAVSTGSPRNAERGNEIFLGRGARKSFAVPVKSDNDDYTPTLVNANNAASITSLGFQYYVHGDRCQVFFGITVTPSVASVQTTVRATLPFPSDINDGMVFGSGASLSGQQACAVFGDNANNAVFVQFTPPSTAPISFLGSFSYRIA